MIKLKIDCKTKQRTIKIEDTLKEPQRDLTQNPYLDQSTALQALPALAPTQKHLQKPQKPTKETQPKTKITDHSRTEEKPHKRRGRNEKGLLHGWKGEFQRGTFWAFGAWNRQNKVEESSP